MTFDEWWDKDIDDSENPYTKDSPIYWAFAGWQARGCERANVPLSQTKPDEIVHNEEK